jgi:hypothetical protein
LKGLWHSKGFDDNKGAVSSGSNGAETANSGSGKGSSTARGGASPVGRAGVPDTPEIGAVEFAASGGLQEEEGGLVQLEGRVLRSRKVDWCNYGAGVFRKRKVDWRMLGQGVFRKKRAGFSEKGGLVQLRGRYLQEEESGQVYVRARDFQEEKSNHSSWQVKPGVCTLLEVHSDGRPTNSMFGTGRACLSSMEIDMAMAHMTPDTNIPNLTAAAVVRRKIVTHAVVLLKVMTFCNVIAPVFLRSWILGTTERVNGSSLNLYFLQIILTSGHRYNSHFVQPCKGC